MAKVTLNQWAKYRDSLSKICKQASDEYTYYFFNISGFKEGNGLKGVELEEAIDVANAIAQKYGYASAEVACQMYDATAKMEKANVPPAVPAEVATREETASAIVGSLKQSNTGKLVESVMYRLVKQAAADTMIQNAKRDGAKWAWVPSGDTCAFCITLASRGWQPASKAQLHGDHAEHIHGNCDCQFMISFKGGLDVEWYDPEAYKDMYYNAEGNSSKERINYLRRKSYAINKESINERRREIYRENLPETISLPNFGRRKSVGAMAADYVIIDKATGTVYHLVDGYEFEEVTVFAGKGCRNKLKPEVAEGVAKELNSKPSSIQHVKGFGYLQDADFEEEPAWADVHWFQVKGGKKDKFVVKEWLDYYDPED